ncbi:MAG: hypothetical protein ACOYUB_04375 [Patescibacteria group bacterium]
MNKRTLFLSLAALVIAGAVIVPKTALAYRGDPNVLGPNYTQERHDAMIKAFESKDYNAWKSLMTGRGRVTQTINAQNFAKFAEVHKLTLQGKISDANAIRAELGLGLKNGSGVGQGMGYGRSR